MYVIFYRNNNDANGGDDQIQLEKPEMERVEWRLLQAARGGRRWTEDSFSSRKHVGDTLRATQKPTWWDVGLPEGRGLPAPRAQPWSTRGLTLPGGLAGENSANDQEGTGTEKARAKPSTSGNVIKRGHNCITSNI